MSEPDGPAQVGRLEIDADGVVLGVDGVAAAVLGRDPERIVGRRVRIEEPDAADPIEIVTTVGHELRSPLTSIRGYTSLLLDRWDRIGDADKTVMLTQIRHDAERVTRLIDELLDISRLETGRLQLRQERVEVGSIAESVVAALAIGQPELDAAVTVAPDVPAVWADPDKVERIVTNLVENAAKYASPRGIEIRVRREPPTDAGPSTVAVAVRDQGPGIAADDLPHVFDRWFQREQGRPTGTGLGLWITRGLVEAHGGTMSVTSESGRGSTFTFTLPVAPA